MASAAAGIMQAGREHDFHPSQATTIALVVSVVLSMLGCAATLFSYLRWLRLRRHPAGLVVARCIMDMVFCAQILASHLYYENQGPGAGSSDPDCRFFSFLSQFTCLAAELYFACLSIDLLISLTNPFTDFRWNKVYYHAGALAGSAAVASLVVTLSENERPVYGRDNYLAICWVRNFDESGHIDAAFWGLFVAPLLAVYGFTIVALALSRRRLAQGLPETFYARLEMFRASLRFVICYVLYWALVAAVYMVVFVVTDASESSGPPPDFLALLLAFAMGGRGLVTWLVWLLTFGKDLTMTKCRMTLVSAASPASATASGANAATGAVKGALADDAAAAANSTSSGGGGGRKDVEADEEANVDLRPHLNVALRREILHYTTLGIARSVTRAMRDVRTDGVKTVPASGGAGVDVGRGSNSSSSGRGSRGDSLGGGRGASVSASGVRSHGDAHIAFNLHWLSRRKEEQGLFDLEARKVQEREASIAQLESLSLAAALQQALLTSDDDEREYTGAGRQERQPPSASVPGIHSPYAARGSSAAVGIGMGGGAGGVGVGLPHGRPGLPPRSLSRGLSGTGMDAGGAAGGGGGGTGPHSGPNSGGASKVGSLNDADSAADRLRQQAGWRRGNSGTGFSLQAGAGAAGGNNAVTVGSPPSQRIPELGWHGEPSAAARSARASRELRDDEEDGSPRASSSSSSGGSESDEEQGDELDAELRFRAASTLAAVAAAAAAPTIPPSLSRLSSAGQLIQSGSTAPIDIPGPGVSAGGAQGLGAGRGRKGSISRGRSASSFQAVPAGLAAGGSTGGGNGRATTPAPAPRGMGLRRAAAEEEDDAVAPLLSEINAGSGSSAAGRFPGTAAARQSLHSAVTGEYHHHLHGAAAGVASGSRFRPGSRHSASGSPQAGGSRRVSRSASSYGQLPDGSDDRGGAGRPRGFFGCLRSLFSYIICGLTCGLLCGGRRGPAASLPRFRFVDYEPHLFAGLRRLNGIDDADYVRALSRTRREKFSEGASAAFLYFSTDERFIVKTLSRAEALVLMGMLHSYASYMRSHPHTLITRFCGLHAVTMYRRTMYFVVMANVLTAGGATIHERYDLKGSWVNRHRTPLEKGQKTDCRYCGQKFRVGAPPRQIACPARPNRPHEPNSVLKDNDLTYRLRLSPATAQALGDQISSDCGFLCSHGITDYSLLLGIHRTKYKLVEVGAATAAAAAPAAAPGVAIAGVSHLHHHHYQQQQQQHSHPHQHHQHGQGSSNNAPHSASSGSGAGVGVGSAPSSSSGFDPHGQMGSASAGAGAMPSPLTRPGQGLSIHASKSGGGGGGSGVGASAGGAGSEWGIGWGLQDLIGSPRPNAGGMNAAALIAAQVGSAGASASGAGAASSSLPAAAAPISNSSMPSSSLDTFQLGAAAPAQQAGSEPEPSREADAAATAADTSTVISGESGSSSTALQQQQQPPQEQAQGAGLNVAPVLPACLLVDSRVSLGSELAAASARGQGVTFAAAAGTAVGGGSGIANTAAAGSALPPLFQHQGSAASSAAGGSHGFVGLQRQYSSDSVMLGSQHPPSELLYGTSAPNSASSMPGAAAYPAVGMLGDGASSLSGEGGAAAAAAAAAGASAWRRSHGVAHPDAAARALQARDPRTRSPSGSASVGMAAALAGGAGVLGGGAAGSPSDGPIVTPFFRQHRGGLRATIVEGPGYYYMGIIDVLEPWGWRKRLERFFKTRIMLQNGGGISAMPPQAYAERFRDRVIAQLIEGYDAAASAADRGL